MRVEEADGRCSISWRYGGRVLGAASGGLSVHVKADEPIGLLSAGLDF